MKTRIQNPQSWNNSAKKPFCTHCNNLNNMLQNNPPLPTNHWVRQSVKVDSPVTCPEILRSLCSFCQKIGHTKHMCPEKRKCILVRKKGNNAGDTEIVQELTDALLAEIFRNVRIGESTAQY